MEQALKDAQKEYRALTQPPRGFHPNSPELTELAGYKGVIVYKIHRSFTKDDFLTHGQCSEITD